MKSNYVYEETLFKRGRSTSCCNERRIPTRPLTPRTETMMIPFALVLIRGAVDAGRRLFPSTTPRS
jgi:hypothetical protein